MKTYIHRQTDRQTHRTDRRTGRQEDIVVAYNFGDRNRGEQVDMKRYTERRTKEERVGGRERVRGFVEREERN